MNKLPNVAFVCVHNSCRSQMAEAIAKIKYKDQFNAISAGTDLSRGINPDAIRMIQKHYDYDMKLMQSNTHVNDLPPIDIVITMGCNVFCPQLRSSHRFDWGLDDPSGESDEVFLETIKQIEMKMKSLIEFINDNYDEKLV